MSAITRLVSAVPGGKAMTGGEATDEVMSRYVGETDVLATVLLVFAAITALVSCLVIANTFAVLIASRTQELALLRCIGADTGQVRSGYDSRRSSWGARVGRRRRVRDQRRCRRVGAGALYGGELPAD